MARDRIGPEPLLGPIREDGWHVSRYIKTAPIPRRGQQVYRRFASRLFGRTAQTRSAKNMNSCASDAPFGEAAHLVYDVCIQLALVKAQPRAARLPAPYRE